MKIFAKRKRKAAAAEQYDETTKERTIFQSDPVVQELLQQDPSSWNAKQRRMVKRYQERHTYSEKPSNAVKDDAKIGKDGEDEDKKDVFQDIDPAVEEPSEVEENQEPVEGQPSDCMPVEDTKRDKQAGGGVDGKKEVTSDTPVEVPKEIGTINSSETLQQSIDPDLQKLLDQLNSKQRRRLTRIILKGDNPDMEAIRVEARSLLGLDVQPTDSAEKTPKRTTKRRKGVDWNTLPPEERMRREEQRRLQKEAAERKASGEINTKYSHPLNSERRRANRRKPKHAARNKKTAPWDDHNESGFHMRRIQKDQS